MSIATELLDAAEKRMRKGGYNAVSFRDLAQDTGIKSSSVHYHFPKKEDLGQALVERYSERFFQFLSEFSEGADTPKKKVKAFSKVYRTALVEDGTICLCGLFGAEIGGLPHLLEAGVQQFFKNNIDWVANALSENMNKAESLKIASTIVASHQGAMMLSISMGDVKMFDDIVASSIGLIADD